MQVRVRGFYTFRSLIGDQVLNFKDDHPVNLQDLLEALFAECGEALRKTMLDEKNGLPRRQVAILVNGVHYTHTPARLETRLHDGDEVSIFPPIAGGAQEYAGEYPVAPH